MSKVDHKGLGKAARKKAKAGDVPPGFAVPLAATKSQAKKRGKARMREISRDKAEDARGPALQARVRVLGVESAEAAISPLCGHDIGLCIRAMHPGHDVQARLWDVWQAMSAARRQWRMRYLGQTGDPQGAAIAMVPDAMQTDQGLTVDLRSPEERDKAAKAGEAYWSEQIAAVPVPQMQMALRSAIDGFGAVLWHAGKPTANGRNAVLALERISDSQRR